MAQPAIYRQRRPRETALYQCLEYYWEEFRQAYTPLYEQFQPFDPLDSEGLTRLFQHHVLEMLTSGRRLSRDFGHRLRS